MGVCTGGGCGAWCGKDGRDSIFGGRPVRCGHCVHGRIRVCSGWAVLPRAHEYVSGLEVSALYALMLVRCRVLSTQFAFLALAFNWKPLRDRSLSLSLPRRTQYTIQYTLALLTVVSLLVTLYRTPSVVPKPHRPGCESSARVSGLSISASTMREGIASAPSATLFGA